MTSSQLLLLRALTPSWKDTPQERDLTETPAYDYMACAWIKPARAKE